MQSLEGGREKESSRNNERERNKTCDLSGFLPPRVCLHLACDQTHDQALCLLWGGKILLSDLLVFTTVIVVKDGEEIAANPSIACDTCGAECWEESYLTKVPISLSCLPLIAIHRVHYPQHSCIDPHFHHNPIQRSYFS